MLQMKNLNVLNILVNFNFSVEKGEFVLIVGENGAGKTTLFNTISGKIRPSSGRIFIDGKDITQESQYKRATWVSNVFQDPKISTIGNMSIRDNLSMAYMRGKTRTLMASSSEERDEIFREKLGVLGMGLENRLDDIADQLSGGQRQAMSVIMALLSDSKILLLDEITAALDVKSSELILDIVKKNVYDQRKTCLMITHDQAHLNKIGDRVFILNRNSSVAAEDLNAARMKRRNQII